MLNSPSKRSKHSELLLNRPPWVDMKVPEGVDAAARILDRAASGRTLIYFDPDVDGLIAGLFFATVLNKRGIKYSTYVNPKRQHGFELSGSDVEGMTVVNGDFLVTRQQTEDLVSHGASLLSIDHHECESDLIHVVGEEGAEGIVINNQYPFEDSRNLFQSGAGMTFLTLREIEPWIDTPTNRALVGVSLLTDVRDIEQPGAWPWLYELYNHKFTGYIRYLINQTKPEKSYNYGTPRLDRNYVDYRLSPSINALFRFGYENHAVDFILGGGYPNIRFQDNQRQLVKKMLAKAAVLEYDYLTVVELDSRDFTHEESEILSNFVGLVCSRYTGTGKSAIGYSIDYAGRVERASFRGAVSTAKYREHMLDLIDGRGHSMAFGIKDLVPSGELWEKLNERCHEAEGNAQVVDKFIYVQDLFKFHSSNTRVIAEKNVYKSGPNRVYIRYTGSKIEDKYIGENFQSYLMDGISIKCFNSDLDPSRDYILAQVERGRVVYYLDKPYRKELSFEVDTDEIVGRDLP